MLTDTDGERATTTMGRGWPYDSESPLDVLGELFEETGLVVCKCCFMPMIPPGNGDERAACEICSGQCGSCTRCGRWVHQEFLYIFEAHNENLCSSCYLSDPGACDYSLTLSCSYERLVTLYADYIENFENVHLGFLLKELRKALRSGNPFEFLKVCASPVRNSPCALPLLTPLCLVDALSTRKRFLEAYRLLTELLIVFPMRCLGWFGRFYRRLSAGRTLDLSLKEVLFVYDSLIYPFSSDLPSRWEAMLIRVLLRRMYLRGIYSASRGKSEDDTGLAYLWSFCWISLFLLKSMIMAEKFCSVEKEKGKEGDSACESPALDFLSCPPGLVAVVTEASGEFLRTIGRG